MRQGDLQAPSLLDYEVVAALRGLTAGGKLSTGRAIDALTDYADLEIRKWPSANVLRRRAFELRNNLSAYDAAYVALAETLDCPLLTRDLKLLRAAGNLVKVEVL